MGIMGLIGIMGVLARGAWGGLFEDVIVFGMDVEGGACFWCELPVPVECGVWEIGMQLLQK